MRPSKLRVERRLRIAAVLIIIGLLIELFTLYWAHPTAFVVFMFVGGLFLIAGVLTYLFTLLVFLQHENPADVSATVDSQ
jgi:polyferredoxin